MSERLRAAGANFKVAGLEILEAIEDKRLRKAFGLRMRCLQAAVDEFVDHVYQASEALQEPPRNEEKEF
jgi:hypothetical protein